MIRRLLSALVVFMILSVGAHFTIAQEGGGGKPVDGRGIKWSTLKRCVRKIMLENGETVEMPIIWQAFPGATVLYHGYEVDLEREVTVGSEKVSKIKVWVLSRDPVPPNGTADFRYWCHGLTFDDSLYSPSGSQVPLILAAGWDEYNWTQKMEQGDIIVYFNKDGIVMHTAVSNGDGTFTSKEGATKQNNKQTKAGMDRIYGGNTKCYRKKK